MSRHRRQQLTLLATSIRASLSALHGTTASKPTPSTRHEQQSSTPHPTRTTATPKDEPCQTCGSNSHNHTECPTQDVVYDNSEGPPRPRAPNEPKPGRHDHLAIPRAIAASILNDAVKLYNLHAKTPATITYEQGTAYSLAITAAARTLQAQNHTPSRSDTRTIQPNAHATLQYYYSGIFQATFQEFDPIPKKTPRTTKQTTRTRTRPATDTINAKRKRKSKSLK